MPTILDNVVRNKGLMDKILQVRRVAEQLERQYNRRFFKYHNNLGGYIRPLTPEEKNYSHKLLSENRSKNSALDWEAHNIANNEEYENNPRFYTALEGKYIDYVPSDIEQMVRLDPLSYVDHPSKIIRDFALRLISGED